MARTFGENLKDWMARRGFTRESLAAHMGKPVGMIDRWRGKDANPELRNLFQLAVGLGVSLDALCAGLDPAYDDLLRRSPDRVGQLYARLSPADQQVVWALLHRLAGEPGEPAPPPADTPR